MNTHKDKCCEKCGTADVFAHIAEAFWATCERNGDCLEWMGTTSSNGYGVIGVNGRQWKAHRIAKALSGTDVPHDLVIDHLCRNRSCVNPAHLRVCTNVENVMAGESFAVKNKEKTVCIRGHQYDTTRQSRKGARVSQWRYCSICASDRNRARYQRMKGTK